MEIEMTLPIKSELNEVKISDLVVLTGANISKNSLFSTINSFYWTRVVNPFNKKVISVVYDSYNKEFSETSEVDLFSNTNGSDGIICPVLKFRNEKVGDNPLFYFLVFDKKKHLFGKVGIKKYVEYGEYPQKYVGNKMNVILEKEFNYNSSDLFKKTNRTYNFGSQVCQEYEFVGKKYIRVIPSFNKTCFKLWEYDWLEKCNESGYVWVEVKPVLWKVDYENHSLISIRGLLSGVNFDSRRQNSFKETDIYKFLNNHMLQDILSKKDVNVKDELDLVDKEFIQKVHDMHPFVSELAKLDNNSTYPIFEYGCTNIFSGKPTNDMSKNFVEGYDKKIIVPIITSRRIYDFAVNMDKTNRAYPLCTFGFYPQNISEAQKKLEKLYKSEDKDEYFKEINDYYTVYYNGKFHKCKIIVGINHGNLFVRIPKKEKLLSSIWDGEDSSGLWVNVSPVHWIIDDERKILIANVGLMSGIPNDKKDSFVHDYMVPEIIRSEIDNILNCKDDNKTISEETNYSYEFDSSSKSDEELVNDNNSVKKKKKEILPPGVMYSRYG